MARFLLQKKGHRGRQNEAGQGDESNGFERWSWYAAGCFDGNGIKA